MKRAIALSIASLVLAGCEYRPSVPVFHNDKPVAVEVNGSHGAMVTAEIIELDGFKFAVVTSGDGDCSICEITTANVGFHEPPINKK